MSSITLRRHRTASVSPTVFMDGALHAARGGSALGGKFTRTETAIGDELTLADVRFTSTGTRSGSTSRTSIPPVTVRVGDRCFRAVLLG